MAIGEDSDPLTGKARTYTVGYISPTWAMHPGTLCRIVSVDLLTATHLESMLTRRGIRVWTEMDQ